jgi:hypothetical protein
MIALFWATSIITAPAQEPGDANPFKKVNPSSSSKTNTPPNPFQPIPLPSGSDRTSPVLTDLQKRAVRAREKAEKNATTIRYTSARDREKRDPSPFRTWADIDGNRVEARLAGVFAGVVNLVTAGGDTLHAPLSRMSRQDQQYLRGMLDEAIADRKRSESPNDPNTTSVEQLEILGAAIDLLRRSRNGSYPLAFTTNREGKPLLSWRVNVLPFIGGNELYALFNRDEPWDSKHNKQLLAFMPSFYRATASKAGEGKTNFLAIRSPRSVIVVPQQSPKSIGLRSRPTLYRVNTDEITDGADNTAMLVEVPDEQAIAWTRPDDWEYVDAESVQQLFGFRKGGFYSVFADGSVNFISDQNTTETLKHLFDRADGRIPELKWPKLK